MNPVRVYTVMHYTYVLQSKKNGIWYTGSTNDLRKRLKLHNDGKSIYTNKFKPWEVIYYEACKNESDARSRESFLKSSMGKHYLNNRLRGFLTLTG